VLCFTTSGTTSLPKFVLHDQRTLLRHGEILQQAYGYDENSRILASTPFCGAFGFATLLGGLATGCAVVSEPVFEPAGALAQIRRHGVSHTYANNDAFAKILALAGGPGDFRRVKLFGFASFSPNMDGLIARAQACGVALTGLYGSSELIALLAAQPTSDSEGDASVRYLAGGKLVYPEARVRARDPESGRVLPRGEAGEIEILSPSLMQGYLDDPEATRRAVSEDGWFRTGDLGYAVSERQFVFLTRMGDTLRLSGFLVNPAEIEQAVQALPGVRACQVVGAAQGANTVPYAFVLLAPGAQADPAGWRAACQRAMAGYKVPAGFTALDAFPSVESANAVKIQKHRLREMAEEILARAQAESAP
jgi:fatty-acyl-CoA synthase